MATSQPNLTTTIAQIAAEATRAVIQAMAHTNQKITTRQSTTETRMRSS